jgi:hypothetical protein
MIMKNQCRKGKVLWLQNVNNGSFFPGCARVTGQQTGHQLRVSLAKVQLMTAVLNSVKMDTIKAAMTRQPRGHQQGVTSPQV